MKNPYLIPVMLACLLSACRLDDAQSHAQHDADSPCHKHAQPLAHSVCAFNSSALRAKLSLHWQDNGAPIYSFANLSHILQRDNKSLLFAMNAGMYNDRYAPIGYTVIDGKQVLSLNLKEGGGNFHLMPNGVFWWDNAGFYVDTSPKMADKLSAGTQPHYATQSGPMLVIDGQIHPKFDPNGTSLKIRNGVGVDCTGDKIVFVISDVPVSFYDFAMLFKDGLGCRNALFLDGGIASALYAPSLGRADLHTMGVMMAVVE